MQGIHISFIFSDNINTGSQYIFVRRSLLWGGSNMCSSRTTKLDRAACIDIYNQVYLLYSSYQNIWIKQQGRLIQPYEYTYYLHPDQMLQVYSPDCGWTRQQQTEGYMLPIVCFQLQRWLSISTMHMCSAHCNAPHEAPDRQTNPLIIFISATVSYRLMSSRTFNSLEKNQKLDRFRHAILLELYN